MKLDAITSNIDVIRPATTAAAHSWRAGQILLAEVIGSAQKNSTRLAIAGAVIHARTVLPLSKGQMLAVEVAVDGPSTILKVLPSTSQLHQARISRALAQTLPHHNSLPESLNSLRGLMAQAARTPGKSAPWSLPAAHLQRQIRHLFQSLVTTAAARDPITLAQAMKSAATPTEAKIAAVVATPSAAAEATLTSDARAQLARIAIELHKFSDLAGLASVDPRASVRTASFDSIARSSNLPSLIDAVESAPSRSSASEQATPLAQLKEALDGTLARITTHHLTNAQNASMPTNPMVVEFPVVHEERVDMWHFELVHERRGESGNDSVGPIVVRLKLQMEDSRALNAELYGNAQSISIRVGADDPAFHKLLVQRIEQLKNNLATRGITVDRISAGEIAFKHHQNLGPTPIISDTV